MDKELLYTILLSLIYGPSSFSMYNSINLHKGAENAYMALKEGTSEIKKPLTANQKNNLNKLDISDAEKIAEKCIKENIIPLLISDIRYPQRLREIYNPPSLLYCKGDISELADSPCIDMVGTRNPSQYSLKLASALSKGLASCGFGIVSGFAVGIDIISHISAVTAGGKTYAVIGCGINYNYPKENICFRDHITENGAIISEYPPDYPPSSFSFPPRNRILSGMSLGTVVIEAALKSGSLITANHANDQNRDLFAVTPCNVFDLRYGGNISLIRDGAIPVMGIKDILYEYYPEYKDKLTAKAAEIYSSGFITGNVYKSSADQPVSEDTNNTAASSEDISRTVTTETVPDDETDFSELPEKQRLIAEIIKKAEHPVLADEIAEEAGLEISETLSLLTDMEIDGIVTGGAGNTYYM